MGLGKVDHSIGQSVTGIQSVEEPGQLDSDMMDELPSLVAGSVRGTIRGALRHGQQVMSFGHQRWARVTVFGYAWIVWIEPCFQLLYHIFETFLPTSSRQANSLRRAPFLHENLLALIEICVLPSLTRLKVWSVFAICVLFSRLSPQHAPEQQSVSNILITMGGSNNVDVTSEYPPTTPHLNPFGLYIHSSPTDGRGIYASVSIPPGTLIEVSPVLLFNKEEYSAHGQHTALDHYTFVWKDQRKGGEKAWALALGLGEALFPLAL